jgi:uncharacterized protein YbaR (Trm112 family)
MKIQMPKRFRLQRLDLDAELKETERLRRHLATVPCPSCSENTLKLANYSQSPSHFEVVIFCPSCKTKGRLTSNGFEFELSENLEQQQKGRGR